MMDRADRPFVRSRRLGAIAFVIVGIFTVLSVRLWDLQVVNGARYRALAEQNRVLRVPVPPERGEAGARLEGRRAAQEEPAELGEAPTPE